MYRTCSTMRTLRPFNFQLLGDEFVNHNPFKAAAAAWSFGLRQRMFNPLDRQPRGIRTSSGATWV